MMAPNSGVRQMFRGLFGSGERRRQQSRRFNGLEYLEQRIVPALVVPTLNSLSGAPVTVYLDFDGHVEQDASWTRLNNNNAIDTPAYDIDNDRLNFSAEELRRIEEIWYRVSEDFVPFEVNVSTVEPAAINDFESIRVVIGGNGAWFGGGAVGVALLDSFSNSASNTVFVFPELDQNTKHISNTTSHESGHAFGLQHQSSYDANGNKTAEYRQGSATLGAIMGFSDQSLRDVWDIGPNSLGATVIQDDMAAMTRPANRSFRFRTDDFGSSISTASTLPGTNGTVSFGGVLERNDDSDYFVFDADSGPFSFTVATLDLNRVYPGRNMNPGTNLDSIFRLYDSSGNLVQQSDSATSFDGSFNGSLNRGKYFLEVTSIDEPGAVGQYTITGTFVPLPTVPIMLGPNGTLDKTEVAFTWTQASGVKSYSLEVELQNAVTGAWSIYFVRSGVTEISFTSDGFPQGNFRARVRALANNDQFTAYSNYVNFTVDIPAPSIPTLLRPIGEISESFPVFEWTASQNAVSYTLWVTNRTTGQRVIYRTDYRGTTYTHFAALPDGPYTAYLQAVNSVKETSAWSRPVNFVIDAPVPETPRLLTPGSVTTSTNPRFTWTDVKAARYQIQVNNLTTGKTRYYFKSDIAGTQTFVDPTFFAQGVYTAWIQAFNANNEASRWSAPLTFTVDILPPPAVTMTGPVNATGGRLITTLNPTYTWRAVPRAVRYELYANNITTNETRVISRNDIKELSFTPLAPQSQGEIRAWVRAFNAADEAGPWGPVYTFFIDEATPLTPTIVAPVLNPAGSVDNANPTFAWTLTPDAPFYEFELSEVNPNTGALTRVISVNGLTQKSYTIPNAQRLKETSYVARVRGYNRSNEFSAWSSNYNLRIDVPDPVTPTILGPGGTINDTTPVMTWTHNNATIRYEVLIRDLVRDEVIVLQAITFGVSPDGTQAFFTVPDANALRSGTTYRFWARGFNSVGAAGAWSDPQVFVLAQAESRPEADQPQLLADELLVSLLPQRRESPERPISNSNSQQNTEQQLPVEVADAPVVMVAVAEQSQSLPAVPQVSDADAKLIDQALWMLVNPSVPMVAG